MLGPLLVSRRREPEDGLLPRRARSLDEVLPEYRVDPLPLAYTAPVEGAAAATGIEFMDASPGRGAKDRVDALLDVEAVDERRPIDCKRGGGGGIVSARERGSCSGRGCRSI